MPWASFSMLDGPGASASAKTQVSLTRFLQSEVKIIHVIVQNNAYYSAISRWTKQQHETILLKSIEHCTLNNLTNT